MEINSVTAPSRLVDPSQAGQAPAARSAPPQTSQESTVVRLSAQALELNQAETQTGNTARAETQPNVNTERTAARPQEAAEPPGIQFMEDKNTSGRVDTYA